MEPHVKIILHVKPCLVHEEVAKVGVALASCIVAMEILCSKSATIQDKGETLTICIDKMPSSLSK